MMIDDELLNHLADKYVAMQKMTLVQFIEKELKKDEYKNRHIGTGISQSDIRISGGAFQQNGNKSELYSSQ